VSPIGPPRWSTALLRLLVGRGSDGDSIAGDLHEEYLEARMRTGKLRADVWYTTHALRTGLAYARPGRALLERLHQDLRFALRGLARDLGFSATVVVTLALALGAGTAIFSVVDGVMLRPLPFEEPERLVRVWAHDQTSGPADLDLLYSDLVPIREGASSMSAVSMLSVAPSTMLDERGNQPEDIVVARTTVDLFTTLGVEPRLGRLFDEEEARSGERLLVLSHELWLRRFHGDRDVLGRMVHLDLRGFEIIGVLPEGMGYPYEADVWRALTPEEMEDDDREAQVVARLADGATPTTANAEVEAVAARLSEAQPETHANLGATIQPFRSTVVRDVRVALLALLGAVGLVLLIACVNTASLLLSRSARRNREVAIRTALGAGRGRVLSLHLTESLLLAVLSGALGIALGRWILASTLAISPEIPRLESVSLDVRVVVVMGVVSALAGVLFGVGPALHAASTPPERLLRDGSRSATLGGRKMRMQSGLVATEVALSTVLVFLGLLLTSTFRSALTFDRGFASDGLVSVAIDPMHPPDGPDERKAYFSEIVDRVERLGGVRAAALSSHDVLEPRGFRVPVAVEGKPVPMPTPEAYVSIASRDFFATAGIPLLEGEGFSVAGGVDGDAELVVNERFAAAHLTDPEARIGTRFSLDWLEGHVVGIVRDVEAVAGEPAPPKVYASLDRVTVPAMALAIRTTGDASLLIPEIEREVRAVSPDVLLEDVKVIESEIRSSVAPQRFNMLLVSSFAGLALLLAAVGIYGVTALSVTTRRGEIGIRRALGASDDRVAREILRRAMALGAVGLAAGLLGSALVGRLVASLLVGVSPAEPRLMAAVTGVLAAVTITACVLPVARALRIDPRETLT
jgi:predicted permease